MNYETGQAFLSIISMACEAIIVCTKQLNKMDQEYGDYGTSLARGAKAIQNDIQVVILDIKKKKTKYTYI